MKHSKRILAYSAFALIVLLAAFAAIAPVATNVALAQGTVPAAPTGLTATSTGDTSIQISWNAVTGAATYVVVVYDTVGGERTVGTVNDPTTTIPHTGLTKGRTYRYWVRGDNSDGGRGAYSGYVDAIAGPAPARPANLVATGGYLQNTITWDADSGAAHYEVVARLSTEPNNYRDLDTNRVPNNYDHTGLTTGDTWMYWVRAVDSNGVKGLYAGPQTTTVLAPPTVGAPTNFMADLGNTEITISWGDSPGIDGVDITGYEYRYRASGENFPDTWMADTGADKTETITGLTNGQAYEFEVRATTSVGTGDTASRTQTPANEPGVPTNFGATSTHNSVTLKWGAPADDGGAQVSNYRIEVLDDQSWSDLITLASNRIEYTHSSLARATEYQYRIYASNVAGEGSAASTSIETKTSAPGLPGVPVGFGATIVTQQDGGGGINLVWQAPAFDGGTSVLSYLYRHKVAGAADSTFVNWIDVGLDLNATVDGLAPGSLYTFEVLARNAIGRGPAATATTTDVVANTPPTKKPALNISRAENTDPGGDDQFRLEWLRLGVADDGNGDDSNLAITGYTLQWKSDPAFVDTANTIDTSDYPEGTTGIQNLEIPTGQPDAGGKYSVIHSQINADNVLAPGTTYTYRVRAFSALGGGPWSDERSLTTHDNVPDAPAAPTGDGEDPETIEVLWEKPTNDGGADITGYELQVRRVNAEFMTTADPPVENTGNSTITSLPATPTRYLHRGVTADVEYFYRVRAINSVGKGDWSVASAAIDTDTAAAGTPGPTDMLDLSTTTLSATASSITVTWDLPEIQGDFPITSYELQYQRVDDNDVEANNEADEMDWSDAVSVTPTPPSSRSYTHENIPGSAIFHYRVRAVNARGNGTWFPAADGNDVALTTTARDPSRPVLTAIATGMKDVLLQWNTPESNGSTLNGFELQVWGPTDTDWAPIGSDTDTDTQGTQTAGPNDTQFNHSGLTAGAKYYYRIRSLPDAAGNEDGWTATEMADGVSATTEKGVPARPVTTSDTADENFRASATLTPATDDDNAQVVGSITLMWAAIPEASNGGEDITGYDINILDISTRTWVSEASVADDVLTYEDTGLEAGKTYYYILRAVNSIGAGPWSAFISSVSGVGAPDIPELTAVSAGRTSINLSWTVPNNNGTPITGYQIQRSTGGENVTYADITDRGSGNTNTVTQHTDTTGLAPATTYYYRIQALTGDADTASGYSVEDNSTVDAASATTGGGAVPAVPTDLNVVAGIADNSGLDSLRLNWMAPVDVGGSAITGFIVQRWNGDDNDWDTVGTPTAVGTTDDPFVDPNLTQGKRYYYRVAAVNDEGTGPYTYPSVPGTPTAAEVPNIPQNVTATALGPDSIRVTWDEPVPNGVDFTGYMLQIWDFGDADATPVRLANWAEAIVISGAGTTMHIFTGLQPNLRYDFRILTDSGTDSRYVLTFATTHIGAPGKPVLTATGETETSIKLTWTLPAHNGSPINHYEVQMWDTTAKKWGWNGVADGVHNVSHPLRTFTHTVAAGTQNIYRVRGVNDATNDNNGVGDWSTIVVGRTKAAE